MPRSLDEVNAMADAAELSGPARAAFVSRLTGAAAPAEKAPAAEPKAAAPAKTVTPTRTLLARPAVKPVATAVTVQKATPTEPPVVTRTTLATAERQSLATSKPFEPRPKLMERSTTFAPPNLAPPRADVEPPAATAGPSAATQAQARSLGLSDTQGPLEASFRGLDTNARAAYNYLRQTGADEREIYETFLAPNGKGPNAMMATAAMLRSQSAKAP